MAKTEENQGAATEALRVHKTSEVHKRRGFGRASHDAPNPAEPAASEEAANSGALSQLGEDQSSSVSQPASMEGSGKDRPSVKGRRRGKAALPWEGDAAVGAMKASRASQQAASPEAAATKKMSLAASATDSSSAAVTEAIQPTEDPSASAGADSSDSAAEGQQEESARPDAEGESQTVEEAPSDEPSKPKREKKRWRKLVAGIVAALVVAALLVMTGYVAGNRWVRFNDEADMQGKWFVYGTDVPLSFSGGQIVINTETSYAYSIDPTAKTIEYSLGGLAGKGRYWFNDSRNTLVITDGTNFTMWTTLFDDLSHGVKHLFGGNELPVTDASIVLTRTVVKDSASDAGSSEQSQQGAADAGKQDAEKASESASEKQDDTLMVSDIMMDEGETAKTEQVE